MLYQSKVHYKNVRETLRHSPALSTATMNENPTLEIKDTHNKMKSVLLSVKFRTLQSNFDELLKNQAHFFRNCMKVFEQLHFVLSATGK